MYPNLQKISVRFFEAQQTNCKPGSQMHSATKIMILRDVAFEIFLRGRITSLTVWVNPPSGQKNIFVPGHQLNESCSETINSFAHAGDRANNVPLWFYCAVPSNGWLEKEEPGEMMRFRFHMCSDGSTVLLSVVPGQLWSCRSLNKDGAGAVQYDCFKKAYNFHRNHISFRIFP